MAMPQAPQKYANESSWYTFYSETEKKLEHCFTTEPSNGGDRSSSKSTKPPSFRCGVSTTIQGGERKEPTREQAAAPPDSSPTESSETPGDEALGATSEVREAASNHPEEPSPSSGRDAGMEPSTTMNDEATNGGRSQQVVRKKTTRLAALIETVSTPSALFRPPAMRQTPSAARCHHQEEKEVPPLLCAEEATPDTSMDSMNSFSEEVEDDEVNILGYENHLKGDSLATATPRASGTCLSAALSSFKNQEGDFLEDDDDGDGDDYIPESLAFFVAQANSTLEATQKEFLDAPTAISISDWIDDTIDPAIEEEEEDDPVQASPLVFDQAVEQAAQMTASLAEDHDGAISSCYKEDKGQANGQVPDGGTVPTSLRCIADASQEGTKKRTEETNLDTTILRYGGKPIQFLTSPQVATTMLVTNILLGFLIALS